MARKRQSKPSAARRSSAGRKGAAADGGHAVHFLERVHQRVEGEAEDLALSLYHQPAALRAILARLGIAERTARVALALAPGTNGPWAVVTGEGRFVTCLADGMQPIGAQCIDHARFLAHRERLDRDARHIAAALDLTDGTGSLAQLVARIDGPLAREELQALLVLAPLLTAGLDQRFRFELVRLERRLERLCHRQLTARDTEALRLVCRHHRTCANLLLLLGDHYAPLLQQRMTALPLTITVMATLAAPRDLGMLLRLANFFARHAKAMLPSCKRMLMWGISLPNLLLGYVGVSAIGARHTRYRTELKKVWQKLQGHVPAWEDGLWAAGSVLFGGQAGKYLELCINRPDAAVELANEILRAGLAEQGAEQTREFYGYRPAAEPDAGSAFALWAWVPTLPRQLEPLEAQRPHWEALNLLLARAARADPADFCVPFAQLAPPGKRTDRAQELDEGRRLVAAAADQILPARPRQAARVGRNDPCPCGSGLKHKRCCLAKAEADPTRRDALALEKIEHDFQQLAARRRGLASELANEPEGELGEETPSLP